MRPARPRSGARLAATGFTERGKRMTTWKAGPVAPSLSSQIRPVAAEEKANPGAAKAAAVRTFELPEHGEHVLLALPRNAHARVAHHKFDLDPGRQLQELLNREHHAASTRRELDAVVEQVE